MKQPTDSLHIILDPETEAILKSIQYDLKEHSEVEKVRYLIHHYNEWQQKIARLESYNLELERLFNGMARIMNIKPKK